MSKAGEITTIIIRAFAISLSVVLGVFVFGMAYLVGIYQGYNIGKSEAEISFIEYLNDRVGENKLKSLNPVLTGPISTPTTAIINVQPKWSGPELWSEVNKRRVELGVNPLNQRDELCTIASLRLNELLKLGELDGHEGFGNLKERRPDLAYIFDSFSTVAEFLVSGAASAKEAVSLWENTLGHKKIVSGGEFVWGCIYAQEGFGVGISAY